MENRRRPLPRGPRPQSEQFADLGAIRPRIEGIRPSWRCGGRLSHRNRLQPPRGGSVSAIGPCAEDARPARRGANSLPAGLGAPAIDARAVAWAEQLELAGAANRTANSDAGARVTRSKARPPAA